MASGLSDRGSRKHQEDAWLVAVRDGALLCAICDGMGAAASGRPAADLTIERLRAALEGGSLPETLTLAVEEANRELLGRAEAGRCDPESAQWLGMRTTAEVAVFVRGRAHLAHVGDGRIYRFRDGKLTQLTSDHTLEAEYRRLRPPPPETDIANLPKGVIVRALGMTPAIAVDHDALDTIAGDVFLLCSDGLLARLDDSAMEEVLSRGGSAEALVGALMTSALKSSCARWSHGDNLTVVVHVVEPEE